MPVFRHTEVHPFAAAILEAAGATAEEADLIVRHHIASILTGEEDHGFTLGTQLIPDIRSGLIRPGQPLTIEKETPTTLMVHGNFNFGHYVSHHVMTRLIEKAKTSFVAAASIKYQCHVGRLIDYTRMAAEQGMVALMMCDGAWGPKFICPPGSRDRRLGINPWSMALPNDTGGVVGFDMTAAAASGAKLRRARERGEPVPEGWILDKDGKPTTDPADYFSGGSFLPMGGIVAHKGYVLSFVIEAMADILSGMEYKSDSSRPWPIIDGSFMAVFNVEAFRPLVDFKRDLGHFIDWVKEARPVEGSEGVFYPGERGLLKQRQRERDGIDIPLFIWNDVLAAAADVGIDASRAPEPIRAGADDDIRPTARTTLKR